MKKYETPAMKITKFMQDEKTMVTISNGAQPEPTKSIGITLNA